MKNTQPNITQIHMTSKQTQSYAKKKLIVIAIVKKIIYIWCYLNSSVRSALQNITKNMSNELMKSKKQKMEKLSTKNLQYYEKCNHFEYVKR